MNLLHVLRLLLAVVAGTILGNLSGLLVAIGIDAIYGREVTGGVWSFTLPNILYAMAIGFLSGLFAGLIARCRGGLLGALAQFLPLFAMIAVSLYFNRDLSGQWEVKPAVWTWIGLIPAIIGGRLGAAWRRQ
jgi:hypothetical protein